MGLEDIPQAFADAVGINLATAQVILSIAIIFALLLPTMLLARGKNATTIYLIMVFLAECLLVGLGWMPFWILIATVGMMAIAIASLGTGVVMGEG
jgi:hypothetical protein